MCSARQTSFCLFERENWSPLFDVMCIISKRTVACGDRVGIYYQLVSYMKEHFGDDAKGRKKAFYFLPWHFNFLCRYRYVYILKLSNLGCSHVLTV